MEASPGFHYSSPQSAPIQPSSMSYPAVSQPHEPVGEVYSSPEVHSASSTAGVASRNAAPSWNTVQESATSYTSEPRPGALPPPPLYQAGELAQFEANLEYGNSERETEELDFPPPAPYPEPPAPIYQGGELSNYEAIFDHGNEEWETEEQGFMPPDPYYSAEALPVAPTAPEVLPAASTSERSMYPGSHGLGPYEYYLFLTGQLPPGTLTHFSSEYENGADYWDEAHYERYHYPMAQVPTITTQTQEDFSDIPWQQPQYSTKS